VPDNKKFRFELDMSAMTKQLTGLTEQLSKIKEGMEKAGKSGTKSFSDLEKFISNTQKKVKDLSTKIQKAIEQSAKASSAAIKANAAAIQVNQAKIQKIGVETASKLVKLEEDKRKASRRSTQDRLKDINTVKAAEKKVFNERKKAAESVERIRRRNARANQESLEREARQHSVSVLQQIRDRERLTQALERQRESHERINEAIKLAIYIKISAALRNVIKESTILAAQNEVLGTAMNVVGTNMGFTRSELIATEGAMRSMGISIKDSRTTIQRFAQSNLSMTDALNISRAAQDLAAGSIHGSSEALETMTNAIISQLPRQLRQYGIVVNLKDVYRDYAVTLGKSTNSLNKLEKRQAIVNVILDEAAKRSGAYEASMEDVGKILTSLSSRVIPDTMAAFGDFLLPVFTLVTKAVYNLLLSLQELDDGWKALITIITTVITVFLALKVGLGALTLAFKLFGVAVGEAGVLLYGTAIPLQSLILPLTVLAGLVIAASAAWGWYTKQQDAAYNASIKNLSVLKEQEVGIAGAIRSVKDLTLTEEQLTMILNKQARAHSELDEVLKSGKIEREKILPVLEEIAKKQKLATLEARKVVTDEAILRMVQLETKYANLKGAIAFADLEQQDYADTLMRITGLTKDVAAFIVKYVGATVKLAKAFFYLTLAITGFEGAWDKVKETFGEVGVAMLGVDQRNKLLTKSAQKLESATKAVGNSYKQMTGEATKDIKSLEIELKKIEVAIEKRGKKAGKQFPFKEMKKYYDDTIKRIDKLGLKEEDTRRASQKLLDVYLTELADANRKYALFLAGLGASELERLDMEYAEKLRKVEGSLVAETAVRQQHLQARNAYFRKQLTERVQSVKDATNNMTNILRQRLDTAVKEERAYMEITANDENANLSERVQAREDFVDSVITLMKSSAVAQEANFKESADIRIDSLRQLLEKSIISEEEYTERVKDIEDEKLELHRENLDKRIEFIRSAIDEAISEEKRLANEIRKLADERVSIERKGEDAVDKINRSLQSKSQNYRDDQHKADKLLDSARQKLRENDFKSAKKYASDALKLAGSLNKEITEGHGDTKRVIVDQHQAAQIALKKTKEATQALLDINKAEAKAASDGRKENIQLIDDLTQKLQTLKDEKWEAEVKVIGTAKKDLTDIQTLMKALDGAVSTVTIVVNKVGSNANSAKDIAADVASDIDSGPINPIGQGSEKSFAKGAIDIEGPGDERSDSIFARLSRGESIITAKTTNMFKPLLELMESSPMALKDLLVPALKNVKSVQQVGGETTTFGNFTLNVNGVSNVSDFEGLDWRRILRENIAPQLKILNSRKARGSKL
jgi:hypothetical protein